MQFLEANLSVRFRKFAKSCLVGVAGIEPAIFAMWMQRSTTELNALQR